MVLLSKSVKDDIEFRHDNKSGEKLPYKLYEELYNKLYFTLLTQLNERISDNCENNLYFDEDIQNILNIRL